MEPRELRALQLIGLFFVGIAAFQAAAGEWAAAGAMLGLLLVFSAFVTWRSRRFTNPRTEPREREGRTRRLIGRALPILLVLFVALAVYDAFDGDWPGAVYAGLCFGAAVVGFYFNRRRLAEIEPRDG